MTAARMVPRVIINAIAEPLGSATIRSFRGGEAGKGMDPASLCDASADAGESVGAGCVSGAGEKEDPMDGNASRTPAVNDSARFRVSCHL
jgi:hypothetical protein